MGFQIQIQILIQIFAYLNTNTNTNTYLTPALTTAAPFLFILLLCYWDIMLAWMNILTILYCFCQNMHVFWYYSFWFYNKYFSVERNFWNLYLFSALQYIYHYTYVFPLRVNCLSFTTVWWDLGTFLRPSFWSITFATFIFISYFICFQYFVS